MPYNKHNPEGKGQKVLCDCKKCCSAKYVCWRTREVHRAKEVLARDSKYILTTLATRSEGSYDLDQQGTLDCSSGSRSNRDHEPHTDEEDNVADVFDFTDHVGSSTEGDIQSTRGDCEQLDLAIDMEEFKSSLMDSSSLDGISDLTERSMQPCPSDQETYFEKSYENVLYESEKAKIPLYNGNDCKTTVLQALAALFTWFSAHPFVSKAALSEMLTLNKSMLLPTGNNLPNSYAAAEKFIEPFLIPTVTYHVCKNDCVIFRNELESATECPKCKCPRYVGKSRRPVRRFVYYPLGPRWRRMFGDATLSQVVQELGSRCISSQEGNVQIMKDISDSPFFKECFQPSGSFRGDPRGLVLQLSTDGVNPFDARAGTYSMWPIIVSMMNLPPDCRHLYSSLMMVGIIPARGDEEPHIDPYLEVVIDELLSLNGTQLYDAYQNAPFHFKSKVLSYVMDYPGLNKVFHACGSGALAGCMWCHLRGVYNKTLSKTVYIGNRRFLPKDSPLRNVVGDFPNSKVELRGTPIEYTLQLINQRHTTYEMACAGTKTKAASIAKTTGLYNHHCFSKLPEHDRTKQAFPDPMHTIKNCVKNLHHLITGREYNEKVRSAEAKCSRFGLLETELNEVVNEFEQGESSKKRKRSNYSHGQGIVTKKKKHKRNIASSRKSPGVPFVLSKEELNTADKRALSVQVPSGFGWKPKAFFSKCSNMKSHDWKQVATEGVMKFCLRGLLGDQQRQTLFQFLDAISTLCLDEQDISQIPKLAENVNIACALMERDFPMSLQTISYHILHHIPKGIASLGPVRNWWMFAYERFNSWICRRVTNRSYPEATVMRTYQIFDWCNYMQQSKRVPTEVLTRFGSYDKKDEEEAEVEHDQESEQQSQKLEENVVLLLDRYYRTVSKEYQLLLTEVMQDQGMSTLEEVAATDLSEWRPRNRALSLRERELLNGPSNTGKLYHRKSISKRNSKAKIVFRSCAVDRATHTKSSIVAVFEKAERNVQCLESRVLVGEVQYFLCHTFNGRKRDFAILHIFENVVKDASSGLYYANAVMHTIGVATVETLSHPLATAIEGLSLWILNLKV